MFSFDPNKCREHFNPSIECDQRNINLLNLLIRLKFILGATRLI